MDIGQILSQLGQAYSNSGAQGNPSVPASIRANPLAAAGYTQQGNVLADRAIAQQQANQQGSQYVRAAAGAVFQALSLWALDYNTMANLRKAGAVDMYHTILDAYGQASRDGDMSHVQGLDLTNLLNKADVDGKAFMAAANPNKLGGSNPGNPGVAPARPTLSTPGSIAGVGPSATGPQLRNPALLQAPTQGPSLGYTDLTSQIPGSPYSAPPGYASNKDGSGIGSIPVTPLSNGPSSQANPGAYGGTNYPPGYSVNAAMPDDLAAALAQTTVNAPEIVAPGRAAGGPVGPLAPMTDQPTGPLHPGVIEPGNPSNYFNAATFADLLKSNPGLTTAPAPTDTFGPVQGPPTPANLPPASNVQVPPITRPTVDASARPPEPSAAPTPDASLRPVTPVQAPQPGSRPPGSNPTAISDPFNPNNPTNQVVSQLGLGVQAVLRHMSFIPPDYQQAISDEFYNNITNDPGVIAAKKSLQADLAHGFNVNNVPASDAQVHQATTAAITDATSVLTERLSPYLTNAKLVNDFSDDLQKLSDVPKSAAASFKDIEDARLQPFTARSGAAADALAAFGQRSGLTQDQVAAFESKSGLNADNLASFAAKSGLSADRILAFAAKSGLTSDQIAALGARSGALQDAVARSEADTHYQSLQHQINVDTLTKVDPLKAVLFKSLFHPRMLRDSTGTSYGESKRFAISAGLPLAGAIALGTLGGAVPVVGPGFGAAAGAGLGSLAASIMAGQSYHQSERQMDASRDIVFDPGTAWGLLSDPKYHDDVAGLLRGHINDDPSLLASKMPPIQAINGSDYVMHPELLNGLSQADRATANQDIRQYRIWNSQLSKAGLRL